MYVLLLRYALQLVALKAVVFRSAGSIVDCCQFTKIVMCRVELFLDSSDSESVTLPTRVVTRARLVYLIT